MSNPNIFAYKDRLNDCEFEGVVEGTPVTDMYETQNGQPIYRISFLLRQTDMLIPFVAVGKFAMKINAMIEEHDVIFVKCSFRPHRIQDKLLFRFYAHYVVVMQKNRAPSLTLVADDRNNDLDEEQINKILADVLA